MPNEIPLFLSTRREFLKRGASGVGLLAFSQFAPSFLARTAHGGILPPGKDQPILVLIQLAGGNDGLNTLVPFQDRNYYRLRPRLALRENTLIPLEKGLAFHPGLAELARLYKDGKLAVIQNVGYPNPNRSHFRATEIWETAADSNDYPRTGWLGRYFDNACAGKPSRGSPLGINLGNRMPQAFQSDRPHHLFSITRRLNRNRGNYNDAMRKQLMAAPVTGDNAGFLQHAMMDALVTEERIRKMAVGYHPLVHYPSSRLSQSLRGVAALVASGLETRVYFVSQTGYDTHVNQLHLHERLLTELASAMSAFQRDLEAHHLEDQVIAMTFSEFGRRPSENYGGGTDHGTAAPLFVMGSGLKKTLLGKAPDLNLEINQDLAWSIDFRQVYATLLERWLNCPATAVLDGKFPLLDFI